VTATSPLVSAIVRTHQYGRYLADAIDSVLAQDFPQSSLEVLVVDDGSTDETPDVVARYGDRVRYLRHEHTLGVVATTNRGIAEARGELLAFLDADDRWEPGKLRRQTELLQAHPATGLVHSDLRVVDEDDRVVEPSFWRSIGVTPREGRVGAELRRYCFVSQGAMMVRASLRDVFHPVPEGVEFEDWWIALRVADVAEVRHIDEPLYRYRRHGANRNLGVAPAQRTALQRDEVALRRRLLAEDAPTVPLATLVETLEIAEGLARHIAETADTTVEDVMPVTPAHRGRSGRLLAAAVRAHEAGAGDAGIRDLVRALAEDPGNRIARARLDLLLERADLQDTRGTVFVAHAAELTADPALAEAYARTIGAGDDATLVLHAPGRDPAELVAELQAALDGTGLLDGPDLLVLTVAGDAVELMLARRAAAVVSGRPAAHGLAGLRHVGADRADTLRDLLPTAAVLV
jgi:hypothetical protein